MNMTIFYLFYLLYGRIYLFPVCRPDFYSWQKPPCLPSGDLCALRTFVSFSFSDLVWLKTISFFFANFLCLFLLFRVKWYSALFHGFSYRCHGKQ